MYEVNERGTPEVLNVGKRQFLMMGPDNGHVTPLDSGASSKQSSQGGGAVIKIESVVHAAPGTNAAELSAMLDQRDQQLEANIYENMRRRRWNTRSCYSRLVRLF